MLKMALEQYQKAMTTLKRGLFKKKKDSFCFYYYLVQISYISEKFIFAVKIFNQCLYTPNKHGDTQKCDYFCHDY